MKQEGQFSKKKDTNLLQYAIQLVCIFEMKQEGRFSKKSNWWKYATELVCEMKQCAKWNRGAVYKKQQFITVCYSTCVCIEMKQEGQFSKKKIHQFIRVCYSTRGVVFKKQQFITVCYSTYVRIEMKQEG